MYINIKLVKTAFTIIGGLFAALYLIGIVNEL